MELFCTSLMWRMNAVMANHIIRGTVYAAIKKFITNVCSVVVAENLSDLDGTRGAAGTPCMIFTTVTATLRTAFKRSRKRQYLNTIGRKKKKKGEDRHFSYIQYLSVLRCCPVAEILFD